MGIRSAWKKDLKATSAELVFGETIRLPGQFFEENTEDFLSQKNFLQEFQKNIQNLQPKIKRHGQRQTFIS